MLILKPIIFVSALLSLAETGLKYLTQPIFAMG
jgi:hypothetical protein